MLSRMPAGDAVGADRDGRRAPGPAAAPHEPLAASAASHAQMSAPPLSATPPVSTAIPPAPAANDRGVGDGPDALPDAPIVFYDGVCGLCAALVRWILAHERDHDILFAPLQGDTAALARARFPHIPASIDSVVFISRSPEGDPAGRRAYLRSKAILHVAGHLRAPWRWGYGMRWLPAPLLDLGYRIVAAVRYRIWGHADACGLATPDQRKRFLP
jgi:predicted DCC family thiol-disulfide oxidoreductase YuxK